MAGVWFILARLFVSFLWTWSLNICIIVLCAINNYRRYKVVVKLAVRCLLPEITPTVNCTFDSTVCGYSVSNTSTYFEFSYVFSISSLGEMHAYLLHCLLHSMVVMTTD